MAAKYAPQDERIPDLQLAEGIGKDEEKSNSIDQKENGSSPHANDTDAEPERPDWKPTRHQLAIMLTLSITAFVVSIDALIVTTTIPDMIADLGGDGTEGFWIGTSYLLTFAVVLPFVANVSDIFGRPPTFLIALALFAVGTIVCCVAENIATLIAGRCIQGIGGGGVTIIALLIFTDIVPLRFRSKYWAIVQGAWAVGTIIGPVIGGAFTANTTWRWVFYINFPFIGLAAVIVPLILTLKPRTESLKEKLARVDWIGGFLFISSATAFLIAVTWGGTQHSWSSFRTIVPLVLGILGLIGTVLFEAYVAKDSFCGRSLFHSFDAFAAYTGAFMQGFLLNGSIYYTVIYFLAVQGFGPVRAGASIIPAMACFVPAGMIVGVSMARFGSFRWLLWAGWFLLTLMQGLFILWDDDTSTAVWAVIILLYGLAHGLVLSTQNFATQAIALPGDEAHAVAMYSFLRAFGIAFGVGICGNVFQNVMMIRLDDYGLPHSIARNVEESIAFVWSSADDGLRDQIQNAFTYGLRGTFGLMTGVSGIGLMSSLFVRHYDLNKELTTEHKLQETKITRKLGGRNP